jgi:hypothetical protein
MDRVERVNNGVAFLDETLPNWRELMDWDKFSILSIKDCLLGQLFSVEVVSDRPDPTIAEKLKANGYSIKQKGRPRGWIADHGFAHMIEFETAEDLETEWRSRA